MPTQVLEALLVLILTVVFLDLRLELGRCDDWSTSPKASRSGPRPLRPRIPNDCSHCRDAATTPPAAPVQLIAPYAQRKSSRGRKKTSETRGQVCPNPDCDYHHNPDPAAHTLVGDILAPRTRRRFRTRTPAQAAGLTDRRWTVLEAQSVAYPAPPLGVG